MSGLSLKKLSHSKFPGCLTDLYGEWPNVGSCTTAEGARIADDLPLKSSSLHTNSSKAAINSDTTELYMRKQRPFANMTAYPSAKNPGPIKTRAQTVVRKLSPDFTQHLITGMKLLVLVFLRDCIHPSWVE
jgi:hypothetical protein